jgi:cytochrome c-type biogenesis protein CcmH/NrfG
MEYAPLKQLVTGYAKLGNWNKVRTYGEMATFVNPQDVELLTLLGNAYLQTGDGAKALFTYDTALVANPAPRRPALVQLGRARAFVAMNKPKDAKAAIALAMKTEPENAEVLTLKAQLK